MASSRSRSSPGPRSEAFWTKLTSVEVGDHRKHTTVVVFGLGQAQFHEDAADVLFDGAFGDPELACDSGVRAPLGHEGEHLALARGKLLERVVHPAGGDEFLDESGVDDRCAAQ